LAGGDYRRFLWAFYFSIDHIERSMFMRFIIRMSVEGLVMLAVLWRGGWRSAGRDGSIVCCRCG